MAAKPKIKDTYERILESAEELFAKHGFEGTGTREIAARAGISIQTLHYHCGGKQNLYNTVLEKTVVPVTAMINRHVQKMMQKDLNDDAVLEECLGSLIDELFDVLSNNPNFAPLFYRQWLEKEPELRRIEWESLVPLFNRWNTKVEEIVDDDRRKNIDLPLAFLSLSWIYWGLFVQPEFIGRLLGLAPNSPQYLNRLKAHAKNVTIKIFGRKG